jgi:hypothetical protein
MFKSDCMQIVQAINNEQTNHSELESIIEFFHSMLVINNNRKISYVKRQTNRVTHNLA